nr:ankyrin repeat domain-containing protein [Pseudoalteromonas luteoviolacea]
MDSLLEASSCNNLTEVKSLINPFNINEKNEKGWSPIIVAAYHGSLDVIAYLVENGADINDINNNGTSVFMYAKNFALKSFNREYLEKLIDLGADVNLKDFHGLDVFDYVAMNKQQEQIEFMEKFR